MWERYLTSASMKEAIAQLGRFRGQARIVAGATDLILELERGVRRGVDTLIDITRIPGLDLITLDDQGWVHLGPLVTHNHVAGSPLIRERAYALARACWEVGAPQIRNRGTLAGNLITASPANDSITPLLALGAQLTLRSTEGERLVPLEEFYSGVRKTARRPEEMLIDIAFPVPARGTHSAFMKFALRRAQAVSVVNVAVVLRLRSDKVQRAAITLGAVAPTIIHAGEAEAFLQGKRLTGRTLARAAELAAAASRPIDDVRGSASFRREMVRVSALRCLRSIASGEEQEGLPERPVMLWGAREPHVGSKARRGFEHDARTPIETTINGRRFSFAAGQGKTLLRLLREEAGLIGTKEGCAEGECGACTVFLDGAAVMACMVPAPRAHGAEVVTIEGLGQAGGLHPVQQAFIDEGAVQCGYCTPGFILSGAKLLEERPHPTRWEVQQALTGNLCRCTGYYSIVAAVERAAKARAQA